MIRTMIVDDEPLAIQELQRLVEKDHDFEVVMTAENGREALNKLQRQNVDVVFLDIDMPIMNGLDVAKELCSWDEPPVIAFSTAYHHYAVDAFEANAIDYFLKPYDYERVQKSLVRVKNSLLSAHKNPLQSMEKYATETLRKIIGHVHCSKDKIVIDPSEIFFFKVQYGQVVVQLIEQKLEVGLTLKEIEERLDPAFFARCHKSYVVNLDKVLKVAPLFNGNFELVFSSEQIPNIPLSRRYAVAIKKHLGRW